MKEIITIDRHDHFLYIEAPPSKRKRLPRELLFPGGAYFKRHRSYLTSRGRTVVYGRSHESRLVVAEQTGEAAVEIITYREMHPPTDKEAFLREAIRLLKGYFWFYDDWNRIYTTEPNMRFIYLA